MALFDDSQIPSPIARDSEVQAAIDSRQHASDRLTEIVSGFVAASPLSVPRKNAAGNAIEYAVLAVQGGDLFVIRQSAKPTTRSDGSALQVGDRWIQLGGSMPPIFNWVWNGTYWLSEQVSFIRYGLGGTLSANLAELTVFEPQYDFGMWLHNGILSWRTGAAAHDTTNFFTFSLVRRNESGLSTSVLNVTTQGTSPSTRVQQSVPYESAIDIDSQFVQVLRFSATRTGSTVGLTALKLTIPTRLIHSF